VHKQQKLWHIFHRATLCVSAVPAVGRCLTVRHVRVLYPNRKRYRPNFLTPGNPIVVVSWSHPTLPNSKKNPLALADQSASVSMTLSDLEKREARGQPFHADLLNYGRTVWPRSTKISSITQVGEEHIYTESATPLPQVGRGPSSPNLGFPITPISLDAEWPNATQ